MSRKLSFFYENLKYFWKSWNISEKYNLKWKYVKNSRTEINYEFNDFLANYASFGGIWLINDWEQCKIPTKIQFQIFSLIARTFKTFKLKKRSSTLGINKTSESPPMLRHDDGLSLGDRQLRHTVNIGLGNNFQRGAPSRSSLQDISSRVSTFHLIQHTQIICSRFFHLPTNI